MDSRYRWDGLWQYALLGAAGFVLFGWLFQHYSPATSFGVTLNREAAIARAQTIAQQLGWPVNDWEPRAWSEGDSGQLIYYGTRNPDQAAAPWLPSARFNVNFRSPKTPQTIQVQLAGNGQLLRFASPRASFASFDNDGGERRGGGPPPPRNARSPEIQKPAQATPANAQLAAQTLAQYFPSISFNDAPVITNSRLGFDFTWQKTFPHDPRLTLEAVVEIAQDRVNSVDLAPRFSPEFQAEYANVATAESKTMVVGAVILLLLLLTAAMAFVFFDSMSRNEIQQRPALRLLFGSLLLFLFVNVLSGYQEVVNIGANTPNRWLTLFLRLLVFTLMMAGLALICYLFWVAGHALAARRAQRRTVAFELLLAGRFTHSYVARQALIGLCLAAFVILPSYLLKATVYRGATLAAPDVFELFSARVPALMATIEIGTIAVFIIFAFGIPLLETYVTRWPLTPLLMLALGGLGLLDNEHLPYAVSAQLLTGWLAMAFLYWLYRQHDLLAVLVAYVAGYSLLHAAVLLAQPLASLRMHGFAVIIALAAAALVALLFVKRGAALDEKLFEPLHATTTSVERERLKAEIEVATRAQQQMLPAAPPHIPGLEIAASCNPSKDVGGDLFDFLNLPDGRLGIVVADVSGKGVPAALYMTLTKGVLAAITEYESDPGAILREANRHLYEACRKKVFVTLFLGVYDPATRQLTYARAGHNPTVYRSRSRNHTELLKPRGMGLGLAGEKIFNPTLAVASLQLHTDDLLYFYSDGITEAMNNQREEYGEERLMDVAVRHDGSNATIAHDAVLADVKNFLGNVAPQDDQTLVVLRVCET